MSRHLFLLSALVLALFATAALAQPKADNAKTGNIKSFDAKAKTFVLAVAGGRDLTFTVNDKTALTLDSKASTFDAAIKAGNQATVNYSKVGEDRVATKVEVTAPEAKPAK